MFNVLAREMIYKIQFLLKCAWNRKGKETENKIFYLVITDLRKVFAARKSGRERERGSGSPQMLRSCFMQLFVKIKYSK